MMPISRRNCNSFWVLYEIRCISDVYFYGRKLQIILFISLYFSVSLLTKISNSFCVFIIIIRGGISVLAFGQALCFTCVSVGLDPKGQSASIMYEVFQSAGSSLLFICGVVALLLQSIAVQRFSDRRGFFSSAGPVFCGQIFLSSCLEMAGKIPYVDQDTEYAKATGTAIAALSLVLIGSVCMWVDGFKKQRTAAVEELSEASGALEES